MLAYDYKCQNCGHIWEVRLSSITDNPANCPNCNSRAIKRLFPAPYITKGTGTTTTCCGRTERCETPPCSTNGICQRK